MSVYLSSQKVIKDWIDYNDHMNVSYYLLMFDKYGADTLNNMFKMGEHSAKTTKKSTMIVESHITYNQELQLNDEVDINFKGNENFIKVVKSSAFCSENNEIISDNYKITKDQKIGIIPPIGGG